MGVYKKQNPERFVTIPTAINDIVGGTTGTPGLPTSGLSSVMNSWTLVFEAGATDANNQIKDIDYKHLTN